MYESEDEAVKALENATEYLWGMDWDYGRVEEQVVLRLRELEDGIALQEWNPYFIPEQEETPDEPLCSCRVPGDVCSIGKYDPSEVNCDWCLKNGYSSCTCDKDMVAADGSLEDLLCRVEHLYALALANAARLEQIEENLNLRPRPLVFKRQGMTLPNHLACGVQGGPTQQAFNRSEGFCNCSVCQQRFGGH